MDIEITETRVRDSTTGAIEIAYRLSSIPGADWQKAFTTASVHYEGQETLDFLAIAGPAINRDAVLWKVPTNSRDQARQYVQQRIDHANAVAPLPNIAGIEEPSNAGGQWHAMKVLEDSWPGKTLCGNVEPHESWRSVSNWVDAGERRCGGCSDLTSREGFPRQDEVRRALQFWSTHPGN